MITMYRSREYLVRGRQREFFAQQNETISKIFGPGLDTIDE